MPDICDQQTKEITAVDFEEWFHALPAGMVAINRQGNIIKFNQAAKEVFPVMENNTSWNVVIQQNVKDIINNGDYIVNHIGKHLVFKTQALPNQKGQLILLMDETVLKNKSDTQIKLEKLASIEKLSATLAHQLKTPLATALLYAANLLHEQINIEQKKEYHAKLLTALNQIKEKIDLTLCISKNEDKFIEKIYIQKELATLINNLHFLHPQVNFTFKQVDEKKYAYILGNKQAIKTAFLNIIENAMQACIDDARIEIEYEINNSHIIKIIDFGIGMSSEVIDKLATPFFTTKKNGTGLGYVIAKSIIEAHQGSIQIASKLHQYSSIMIEFPLCKETTYG